MITAAYPVDLENLYFLLLLHETAPRLAWPEMPSAFPTQRDPHQDITQQDYCVFRPSINALSSSPMSCSSIQRRMPHSLPPFRLFPSRAG